MSFPLVLRMSPSNAARTHSKLGLFAGTAAAVAIAAGSSFGVYHAVIASSGGGGGNGTFNVFLSPTGNNADATNCKRFVPAVTLPPGGATAGCKTITKAYQVATYGDTVGMEPGTFPYEEVFKDVNKTDPAEGTCDKWTSGAGVATTSTTTNCINFRPVTTSPTVTEMITTATFLYFKDINFNTVSFWGTINIPQHKTDSCDPASPSGHGHDIIVENSTGTGNFDGNGDHGLFGVAGAHNLSLINDSFGNTLSTSGSGGSSADFGSRSCATTGTDPMYHVLLDHITMHDVMVSTASIGHGECIAAFNGGSNITIINSKFENCIYLDISWEPVGTTFIVYDHWTVENNYFDTPCSHCASLGYKVGVTNPTLLICHKNNTNYDHFVFRNNSYVFGSPGYQVDTGISGCSWTNNTWTGNIFAGISGGPNGTQTCANTGAAKNVLLSASGTGLCGNDVAFGSTTPPYNDIANYDFSLNSLTAGVALNEIPNTTGYPTTDINGDTRTNPADAGANEN